MLLYQLLDSVQKAPDTRVAFTSCVGHNDLVNLQQHQVIVFDHVITNHDNAYDNTTGLFRAPLSGVYAFHFSAMSIPYHRLFSDLMSNGHVKSRTDVEFCLLLCIFIF